MNAGESEGKPGYSSYINASIIGACIIMSGVILGLMIRSKPRVNQPRGLDSDVDADSITNSDKAKESKLQSKTSEKPSKASEKPSKASEKPSKISEKPSKTSKKPPKTSDTETK